MTEDEMVEWHHQLDGHEFEQAPGVGDGQGSLVSCCGVAKSWTQLSDRTEPVYCKLHESENFDIFLLLLLHCLAQSTFVQLIAVESLSEV